MKYDLIAEAYINILTESKIASLKTQNPQLSDVIDKYSSADPTPQKKFVPWLLSQHKKGNVSPHDVSLQQTLKGFEDYKNVHKIKDHSVKTYQDIKNAVQPLLGSPVSKKEQSREDAISGIEKIYDSENLQAFHVKTKEASQQVYGGGKELGGLHTNWCVSARSEACAFGKQYGKMYSIHAKDDIDSPYAVHPETNTITNRHNNGDLNIDSQLLLNDKIKSLEPAIQSIQKHHDPVGFRLANASDLSSKEIDDVMKTGSLHEKSQLFKNKNEHVIISALKHPDVQENTLLWAVNHYNPKFAITAIEHSKTDKKILDAALMHHDDKVRQMSSKLLGNQQYT